MPTSTPAYNSNLSSAPVNRAPDELIINNLPERVEYACSLLAESHSSVSFENLDTAIILFRKVLDSRSNTHPLQPEAMSYLALALSVRSFYTNQLRGMNESVNLCSQLIIPNSQYLECARQNNAPYHDDTKDMMEMAKRRLTDILKLSSLISINMILQISLAGLGSESHPIKLKALKTLASGLYARFYHSSDMSDLENAMSILHETLKDRTHRGPQRADTINKLFATVIAQFHFNRDHLAFTKVLRQLTRYISDTSTLSEELPSGEAGLNIATQLHERFSKSGNVDDLHLAIQLFRRGSEEFLPDSDSYCIALNHLGHALMDRYMAGSGGDKDDMEEGISVLRAAMKLQPSPSCHDQSRTLNNLAAFLGLRFDAEGSRGDDLNEAILLHKQALNLRPSPHPNRFSSLNNLANALATRDELGGHQADLDEAILLQRQALDLPHPGRYAVLGSLANSLQTQFNRTGQPCDLDEAISLNRQVLKLIPPSHSKRYGYLDNLARALLTQFEQRGHKGNLDEIISLYRAALDLQRPLATMMSSPNRRQTTSLTGLAEALQFRYTQAGHYDDIDEAILLRREALDLNPPQNSDDPNVLFLGNLASVLQIRYQKAGHQSAQRDLDEAIALNRTILELQSPLHPDRWIILHNLANALNSRFMRKSVKQTHDDDLEEAILLLRKALDLQPQLNFHHSTILGNIAIMLRIRFRQAGRQGDLEEAISLNRQALELRPSPHPDRCNTLHLLATTLATRFRHLGQQVDLDEAILLHREALDLQPPPNSDRSMSFLNLGELFVSAHESLMRSNSNSGYLEDAMDSFMSAFHCSQGASYRFHVARTWSSYADLHHHSSAIAAYDAAMHALSQMTSLSLDIQSRQKVLATSSDGLARKAAQCAIKHDRFDRAIEYLEGGRAVFWSQVLHLRSPFNKLRDSAPELADRLKNIATELERGSHRNTFVGIAENRTSMAMEKEASRLKHLDEEWAKGVSEAQKLKGFEDFLQPRRLASLQAAADCPIVFLIPNDGRSDCLIMTLTKIHHIPLSTKLTGINLQVCVHLIRSAALASYVQPLSSIGRNADDSGTISSQSAVIDALRSWVDLEQERLGAAKVSTGDVITISSNRIFEAILSLLWNELVKPVIECLGLKKSDDNPIRLQWCPTGPFTFLPIHAAGSFMSTVDSEKTSDYIISSYMPTIENLLSQNSPSVPPPEQKFEILAVIDTKRLHSTQEELAKIKARVPNDCLVELGIPGAPARVETVISHLPTASIVHFACHGRQDKLQPLDSALLLEDGELKISKIMQQPLPNGSLAFLCACETAMGDEKLPDEAMSLGASLLFSGFRSVVATMWKMTDADGPLIADAFYEELFRGPDGNPLLRPDITKSAEALHVAVNKLRSTGVEFRRWVPFIHLGK